MLLIGSLSPKLTSVVIPSQPDPKITSGSTSAQPLLRSHRLSELLQIQPALLSQSKNKISREMIELRILLQTRRVTQFKRLIDYYNFHEDT
jgi:hypothetical protein